MIVAPLIADATQPIPLAVFCAMTVACLVASFFIVPATGEEEGAAILSVEAASVVDEEEELIIENDTYKGKA